MPGSVQVDTANWGVHAIAGDGWFAVNDDHTVVRVNPANGKASIVLESEPQCVITAAVVDGSALVVGFCPESLVGIDTQKIRCSVNRFDTSGVLHSALDLPAGMPPAGGLLELVAGVAYLASGVPGSAMGDPRVRVYRIDETAKVAQTVDDLSGCGQLLSVRFVSGSPFAVQGCNTRGVLSDRIIDVRSGAITTLFPFAKMGVFYADPTSVGLWELDEFTTVVHRPGPDLAPRDTFDLTSSDLAKALGLQSPVLTGSVSSGHNELWATSCEGGPPPVRGLSCTGTEVVAAKVDLGTGVVLRQWHLHGTFVSRSMTPDAIDLVAADEHGVWYGNGRSFFRLDG